MDASDRRFLLTAAWLFAHHGQGERARVLYAALVEDDPRDGLCAAAYAERLLEDREPETALAVLRAADFGPEQERAGALLETRALAMLGKVDESHRRWARYVEASKGSQRQWI